MGLTLEKIYKVVTDKSGFKGRMRLAVRTGVSLMRARQMEDTAEIVAKFKEAADEILGQDIDQFLGGE
jgi:hypothetical protein